MTDQRDPHLDSERARAGSTPGVARYVLLASMVLIIVLFAIIYFAA